MVSHPGLWPNLSHVVFARTHTHIFHMFYLPGTLNNHILMDVLVKQPIRNGCLEYQVYVNSHVFNIYREGNNLLECFCMNTIKLAFAFAAWKKQERFCQKKSSTRMFTVNNW